MRRSTEDNQVKCDVVPNEISAITLLLKNGCLTHIGSVNGAKSNPVKHSTVDNLDNTTERESEDGMEIDLTPTDGWTNRERSIPFSFMGFRVW